MVEAVGTGENNSTARLDRPEPSLPLAQHRVDGPPRHDHGGGRADGGGHRGTDALAGGDRVRCARVRAVALARLCGQHRVFPASLGALAYLEALLLLGIAVTGLIPYDAGYNWLSLAAGAVGARCCRYASASASADPRPRPRPDRPAPPWDAP